MKKTKFKLIINSDSYRIYVNDGIEYCKFKNKYYPLDQIENAIYSYKIGGVPPSRLQISDIVIFIQCLNEVKPFSSFSSSTKQTFTDYYNSYTNEELYDLINKIIKIYRYKITELERPSLDLAINTVLSNSDENTMTTAIKTKIIDFHKKIFSIFSYTSYNSGGMLSPVITKNIKKLNNIDEQIVIKLSAMIRGTESSIFTTIGPFFIGPGTGSVSSVEYTFKRLFIHINEELNSNILNIMFYLYKIVLTINENNNNIQEFINNNNIQEFINNIEAFQSLLPIDETKINNIINITEKIQEIEREIDNSDSIPYYLRDYLNTFILNEADLSAFMIIVNKLKKYYTQFNEKSKDIFKDKDLVLICNFLNAVYDKIDIKGTYIDKVTQINNIITDLKKKYICELLKKYINSNNEIVNKINKLITEINELITEINELKDSDPSSIIENLTIQKTNIAKLIYYLNIAYKFSSFNKEIKVTGQEDLNEINIELIPNSNYSFYILHALNSSIYEYNEKTITYITTTLNTYLCTNKIVIKTINTLEISKKYIEYIFNIDFLKKIKTLVDKYESNENLSEELLEYYDKHNSDYIKDYLILLQISDNNKILSWIETEKEKLAKQTITANPSSAIVKQAKIQIPPQTITANPSSATLEQKEIQIPPQSITVTPSNATLEQNPKEAEATAAAAAAAAQAAQEEQAAKHRKVLAKQRITAAKHREVLAKQRITVTPSSANLSSATLEQNEIQIPPQSITVSPLDATLEQKEIQIPPQSITANLSSATLEQKEIQIPPQSITANQSSATLTQQKKTLLSLNTTERLKLIKTIIKTIKDDNSVNKIYTYYIYAKYIEEHSNNIEEEERIKKIIEKNKIKEYNNICDAINVLMVYLTTTARNIQEKYMDQEECKEYELYYETLVFNDAIIKKIKEKKEKEKEKEKYKYTINYMKQLFTKLPKVFDQIKDKNKLNDLLFSEQKGGNNNYKTLIDNIFNYTEDSDEYDILYDSDISEESTISIRSDYSEDLITPLLSSQA